MCARLLTVTSSFFSGRLENPFWKSFSHSKNSFGIGWKVIEMIKKKFCYAFLFAVVSSPSNNNNGKMACNTNGRKLGDFLPILLLSCKPFDDLKFWEQNKFYNSSKMDFGLASWKSLDFYDMRKRRSNIQ